MPIKNLKRRLFYTRTHCAPYAHLTDLMRVKRALRREQEFDAHIDYLCSIF